MDRAERNRRQALRRRGIVEAKRCVECGEPAISNRHQHCAWCRVNGRGAHERLERERRRLAERDADRPSPEARGYGAKHRRLRAEWSPRVAAGGVMCARCGKPIHPGADWDLGHVDGRHDEWWGPEHAACNRATATHAKQRREEAQRADDSERLRGR